MDLSGRGDRKMVVTIYITTNKIGRIRLAMGMAEKAIPNGLARSKAQEKNMKLKMRQQVKLIQSIQ